MNPKTYTTTTGERLEIGQRIRFKSQYGPQNCHNLETTGEIIGVNEHCQIIVKIPFKIDGYFGKTDEITIHGEYDFKTKNVIFGQSKGIIQFDYHTRLNRYLTIV